MIKVCHMTSVHPPEDIRIFKKECLSLVKAGYDVTLVQQGSSCEKDGVHILGFGEIAQNRFQRMLFTSRKVYRKALEADADIYHFHDPELLPYGLKLKRKGKKVIFDSHERYVEQIKVKYYLPRWCASLIAFWYSVYERYVLRKIDGLVFPCLKDGMHPFAGQCRHITTLDNVPLLEELYDHYDAQAEKWERSVCCPGSLSYIRGITHLVRASAGASANLYLAGNFSPKEYESEIFSLPEADCIHYLGQVDREGIKNILQHCQVGVSVGLAVGQYNQYDNLSTKAYEFMAMGLPVVFAKCPYHEKILEKYPCGICVEPDDVSGFTSAIRTLLDNPASALQMGRIGRRAINEAFNWSIEEKKLLALYKDILSET